MCYVLNVTIFVLNLCMMSGYVRLTHLTKDYSWSPRNKLVCRFLSNRSEFLSTTKLHVIWLRL